MREEPDYPPRTDFKTTEFSKTDADSVLVQAWFDELPPPARPSLWVKAKDGDTVCITADRLEKFKTLLRRGRNP